MSRFEALIEAELHAVNLTIGEWQELLQRLLDYGVICRDESQVECDLYDRLLRIEHLVDDYLALIGVRLHFDKRFQFVRVIPPGARIPGVDDETDTPVNGGYRLRLGQQEIALLLTLRSEYDKALREGQVDENGCVMLSQEALSLAFKNLLQRSLPENMTERKQLLKRLRQLRLIHFRSEEELDSGEAWLRIRPMIVSFVNDDVLMALGDEQGDLSDGELTAAAESSSTETEQPIIEASTAGSQNIEPERSVPENPELEITEPETSGPLNIKSLSITAPPSLFDDLASAEIDANDQNTQSNDHVCGTTE